jgi:hypothetical protein
VQPAGFLPSALDGMSSQQLIGQRIQSCVRHIPQG